MSSGPSAVEIQNLSFTYPGAESAALSDISLRVEFGERLGILGPNGGGKSTLLKLILGLLSGHSGSLRVCGLDAESARRAGLIGYVPQKLEAELGLPISGREVVALGAGWRVSPLRGLPREIRARVDEMIELVGASAYADRAVGGLSGGQLQRILIARALATNARILALDEPTVGIDAAGQQKFAELLDAIHARSCVKTAARGDAREPLTILIISHDIRAIAAGSDRVACLSRRLHSHTSPRGLTPQVLAELFAHEIAGLPGSLQGMHIHAHGQDEPCADATHAHGAATGFVPLGVDVPRGSASPQSRAHGASPRERGPDA